jgi:trehalose 6-phosphate phosphatase
VKHLFGRDGRAELARFIHAGTLVAFDYDGTLAPIVTDPKAAWMRARTVQLVRAVARRYTCVVVTGRERKDVMRFLDDVPFAHVVGNHGGQLDGRSASPFRKRVASWARRLEAELASVRGIFVEHKSASVSVHWRGAPDEAGARVAIAKAVARIEGARVTPGKKLTNLVPRDAPDKGWAVAHMRERLGCRRVLFAGDDVTDEDVFALRARWLLSVRVGRRLRSAAAWYLRDQREVDRLLEALLT